MSAQSPVSPHADDVELEVGHVHGEVVLYSTRNAVDRVVEALRRRALVGFVEPAYSVAERLGLVRFLLVTHEGHAVVGDADGVRPGPGFEELAESLRSNLSAGVVLEDHEVGTVAMTVPPLIGERMEAAQQDVHPLRTVFVLPGADAPDLDLLATMLGGAATVSVVDGRAVVVVEQSRPGSLWPSMRPAVQVTAIDNTLQVHLWSRHGVRRFQSPRKRLARIAAADVGLYWAEPPIRIATGTPRTSTDPAFADLRDLEAAFHARPDIDVTPILGGLRAITAELGLGDGAVDRVVALQREPWDAALIHRCVAAFGLPDVVADLATGDLDPAGLDGALSAPAPTGMMHRRLERTRGHR